MGSSPTQPSCFIAAVSDVRIEQRSASGAATAADFFALRRGFRSRRGVVAFRVTYWVFFTLLFWSAAKMRFHLPHWPSADRDSWGYVHAALSKFAGGPFEHTFGRNLLYPAFVYLMLVVGRGLPAITVIQHSLGLATGALILAAWERLGRFLRAIPKRLQSLGGLLVAAIYLLSQRPVRYEHLLRPEAITPFFAILNILLTLIFLEERYHRPPSNRAAVIGALLLVNSAILATLKTSFMLSVWFSAVPVLVAMLDRREVWSRRIAVLAAGGVAAAAMIIPEAVLGRSDPQARAFLPESLFSIHANLIVAQMDEDVARGDCAAYSCELVSAIAAATREDMVTSWKFNHNDPTLGFDPDYLFYNRASMPSWPARFFDDDPDKLVDFCAHYYRRTLMHRPGAMLQKIVTQLGLFYAARNPSFTERRELFLRDLYQSSAAEFSTRARGAPEEALIESYVQATAELQKSTAVINPPLFVRVANWTLEYAYRPVLLGVLACALAALFSKRARRSYGLFAGVVLFLFSYNFGNALGTAIVHTLRVARYNEAQYSFSLLALCAGIVFLLELTLRATRAFVRRSLA